MRSTQDHNGQLMDVDPEVESPTTQGQEDDALGLGVTVMERIQGLSQRIR